MSNSDYPDVLARRLQSQHRRLNERLVRIEIAWSPAVEVDPDQPSPHMIEELVELRNELARHFIEEEEGGCLEAAECRCPSLGKEVRKIECEHAELLANLDQIIAVSRSPDGHARDGLVGEACRSLTQRIHDHEAAENRVLAQAFGTHVDPTLSSDCSCRPKAR